MQNIHAPLIDPYNRKITSLRISITQRCNLSCIYCHGEGESISPHTPARAQSEISRATIAVLVRAALAHGVRRIKFTGGEPLLRSDFADIISNLPRMKDISVTTNGTLLSECAHDLAAAGLHRVNISLDTLQPDRYRRITGHDMLNSVLDGVAAAVDAGLTPVKLNMVLLSGTNDDEIWDLIDFARESGDVILQIIELMDFTGVSGRVDMGGIEDMLRARASTVVTREMHRRKKYLIDGAEVEVVRPIDNSEFCANCNRLRVTACGQLKGCLLSNDGLVDISDATEDAMHALLEKAVAMRKPYYSPDV
ncbi:MAG: GTP 3',8-cyclase MoaA [Methanosarcinales archaeon]|nr:GTP 3',8-cyclase MoaA [Methanosarcinales archaeon]MCK4651488.1 GTP 3',8-cyclase MoaA [Methanosarcinales archaeon]